jgi:hypothetical protein
MMRLKTAILTESTAFSINWSCELDVVVPRVDQSAAAFTRGEKIVRLPHRTDDHRTGDGVERDDDLFAESQSG